MTSNQDKGMDHPESPSLQPSPVAAFIEAAAASTPVPLGRKGKYCCVVGCQNNQGRDTHRGIKFHIFPKDPDRRERWNKAVNRTPQGKPSELWRASPYDVICSEHFAGGRKSDGVDSDSYIPSIFPTHTVKSRSAQDIAREERCASRKRTYHSRQQKKKPFKENKVRFHYRQS